MLRKYRKSDETIREKGPTASYPRKRFAKCCTKRASAEARARTTPAAPTARHLSLWSRERWCPTQVNRLRMPLQADDLQCPAVQIRRLLIVYGRPALITIRSGYVVSGFRWPLIAGVVVNVQESPVRGAGRSGPVITGL